MSKREKASRTHDEGFGHEMGLVSVRILSTHISIGTALPLISSRALISFLAPLFATPKTQKITTTDLQIPKRTATEQTTRTPSTARPAHPEGLGECDWLCSGRFGWVVRHLLIVKSPIGCRLRTLVVENRASGKRLRFDEVVILSAT